ncbi:MAG: DUF3027 domain-containing protein [Rhodoluna sp.]|nr:DUF3027 domain-containing protein [Rhodoluna sp.]
MPKTRKAADNSAFALEVLKTEKLSHGAFISSVDEGDDTVSYLFKCELKGYLDWQWSVTVYQPEGAEPTLSEFVLLPGETSLVAPDWVPWSERLADYKALQAELEAQAALDAEEAEDSEEAEDDSDEDEVEIVDVDEDELLAPAISDEGESAESDTEDAGKRPPRSRGRNRRGKSKKND